MRLAHIASAILLVLTCEVRQAPAGAAVVPFNVSVIVQAPGPVGPMDIPSFANFTALVEITPLGALTCAGFGIEAWHDAIVAQGGIAMADGDTGMPILRYYNLGLGSLSNATLLSDLVAEATPILTNGDFPFIITNLLTDLVPFANACKTRNTCNVITPLQTTGPTLTPTTSDNQRAYPNLFSVLRTNDNTYAPFAQSLYAASARTVTVIAADNSLLASSCVTAYVTGGFTITSTLVWPTSVQTLQPSDVAQIFKDVDPNNLPDVLAFAALGTDIGYVQPIMDWLKVNQYNYKAFAHALGPMDIIQAEGDTAALYTIISQIWSPKVHGGFFDIVPTQKQEPWTMTNESTTAELFMINYNARSGGPDAIVTAGYQYGMLGAWAISMVHVSLNLGASLYDASTVANALDHAYQPGLGGLVNFIANSGVVSPTSDYVTAIDGNNNDVAIAPLSSATGNLVANGIYPRPLFQMLVPEVPSLVNVGYVLAAVFTSVLGRYLVNALVESVASAYMRHHPRNEVIKWWISVGFILGTEIWASLSIMQLALQFNYLMPQFSSLTYDFRYIGGSMAVAVPMSIGVMVLMTLFGLNKNPVKHVNSSTTTTDHNVRPTLKYMQTVAPIPGTNANPLIKPKRSRSLCTPKAWMSSALGALGLTATIALTFLVQVIGCRVAVVAQLNAGALAGACLLVYCTSVVGLWVMFHVRRTVWRGIGPIIMSVGMIGGVLIVQQTAAYTRTTVVAAVATSATVVLIVAISDAIAIYFFSMVRNSYILSLSKDHLDRTVTGYKNEIAQKAQTILLQNRDLESYRVTVAQNERDKTLGVLATQIAQLNICAALDDHPLVLRYIEVKYDGKAPGKETSYENLTALSILEDPVATAILLQESNRRQVRENVDFIMHVRGYQQSKADANRLITADHIIKQFVVATAPSRINAHNEQLAAAEATYNKHAFAQGYNERIPPVGLFDELKRVAVALIDTNDLKIWRGTSDTIVPPAYRRCQEIIGRVRAVKHTKPASLPGTVAINIRDDGDVKGDA